MFKLDGNRIIITKGDDAGFELEFFTKDGGKTSPSDIVEFNVRSFEDDTLVISKQTTGNKIYLLSNDTKDLKPGFYKYDITLKGSQRQTVKSGRFYIEEDI